MQNASAHGNDDSVEGEEIATPLWGNPKHETCLR
jgi:hypothetical protein